MSTPIPQRQIDFWRKANWGLSDVASAPWSRLGLHALFLVECASAVHANGFTLEDAANYAVLFQGGGNNQLGINNGAGLDGLAAVNGNIGIDNTSPNNGKLQLSGPLVLDGNVNFAGSFVQGTNDNGPYSGNITVNGVISGNHSSVHADMLYLNNLSTTLGGETGTNVTITGNQTINASSGIVDASGDGSIHRQHKLV